MPLAKISKILPAGPVASPAHADTLLELAYLMTAVDGKLVQVEIDAFREIASRLHGTAATDADVTGFVDRFSGSVTREQIETRVREIAPTLPAALRDLAFKLAIGLALVDDDAHDEENALVGVLFQALALPEVRADALASQVRELFGGK
ncbi:MAG: hypothetical protein KF819_33075 [Labilithrix sp.]|nr:hypothetical protein [Labilithrix sp.]